MRTSFLPHLLRSDTSRSPKLDIDAATVQRDLFALAKLVKNTTTSIKSLDAWLVHLHHEHKELRRSVHSEELWKKEVAEIEEQVQSVKNVSTNRRLESHTDVWTGSSTFRRS